MIILLDEQLDTPDNVVAGALNLFQKRHGCSFRSLRSEAPGLQDPDIPEYCRRQGIAALVSANVKDFGARIVMYEGLLAAGISVVVLRPGRLVLTPEIQTTLLLPRATDIAKELAAALKLEKPILLKVTPSSVVRRSLADLRVEIEGGQGLP